MITDCSRSRSATLLRRHFGRSRLVTEDGLMQAILRGVDPLGDARPVRVVEREFGSIEPLGGNVSSRDQSRITRLLVVDGRHGWLLSFRPFRHQVRPASESKLIGLDRDFFEPPACHF